VWLCWSVEVINPHHPVASPCGCGTRTSSTRIRLVLAAPLTPAQAICPFSAPSRGVSLAPRWCEGGGGSIVGPSDPSIWEPLTSPVEVQLGCACNGCTGGAGAARQHGPPKRPPPGSARNSERLPTTRDSGVQSTALADCAAGAVWVHPQAADRQVTVTSPVAAPVAGTKPPPHVQRPAGGDALFPARSAGRDGASGACKRAPRTKRGRESRAFSERWWSRAAGEHDDRPVVAAGGGWIRSLSWRFADGGGGRMPAATRHAATSEADRHQL